MKNLLKNRKAWIVAFVLAVLAIGGGFYFMGGSTYVVDGTTYSNSVDGHTDHEHESYGVVQ